MEEIDLALKLSATEELCPGGEQGLTDDEKTDRIRFHFARIMEVLGLDLSDGSFRDTPARVANMYVRELFSGLRREDFPAITVFSNACGYRDMLVETDIDVYYCCAHYFMPVAGKAHVAYFPGKHVIGLSKIHRLVRHFSKRPQVQEMLTIDIANALRNVLNIEDVAVCMVATHWSVASRGVEDTNSSAVTTDFGGRFMLKENREAFLQMIDNGKRR